jgi:hypothetical protein
VISRKQLRPALRDLLAGSLFFALGIGFAFGATSYDLGSAAQLGPGAFPLILGCLLAVFGATVAIKGLLAPDGEPIGRIPWRAIVLILGGIVFLGVTIRGLGLAPALFVSVLLSALAQERQRLVYAIAIAAGLTVLCVLIFVVALQLRLPLIGPWLGGY